MRDREKRSTEKRRQKKGDNETNMDMMKKARDKGKTIFERQRR